MAERERWRERELELELERERELEREQELERERELELELTIMKKIVEETGEGLEKLLGERVTLFCLNYIYTGKLMGVNEDCVLLSDPAIVYETGPFTTKDWKDAQALPHDLYVMKACIEGYGIVK